jgi:two-component system response regulator (stage 0 sporulation protein F)
MEAAYFGALDMADPKKILVVEDDDSTREALSQILEMEGYETLQAGNGREALETLHHPPDLILLDLRMPGMDGREFLAHQQNTSAAKTPVIVVTASEASDLPVPHLQKPVDLETLLTAIEAAVAKESKSN